MHPALARTGIAALPAPSSLTVAISNTTKLVAAGFLDVLITDTSQAKSLRQNRYILQYQGRN